MAARIRVFIPVGTKEYAELRGVSQRTARRRMQTLPGSVRTGTGWKAPILATEYAKRKGVPVARVRKNGLRAATPLDLPDLIAGKKTLTTKAYANLKRLTGSRARTDLRTIKERLAHASGPQLAKVGRLSGPQWEKVVTAKDGNGRPFGNPQYMGGSEWEGDDGVSILYYH